LKKSQTVATSTARLATAPMSKMSTRPSHCRSVNRNPLSWSSRPWVGVSAGVEAGVCIRDSEALPGGSITGRAPPAPSVWPEMRRMAAEGLPEMCSPAAERERTAKSAAAICTSLSLVMVFSSQGPSGLRVATTRGRQS
jgi:hypothetical protein